MDRLEGDRAPETRQGRERLSVSRPHIEAALASHYRRIDIASTRRFGNRLQADAERWLSRGGFNERGRIGKADAARLLRLELHRIGGAA